MPSDDTLHEDEDPMDEETSSQDTMSEEPAAPSVHPKVTKAPRVVVVQRDGAPPKPTLKPFIVRRVQHIKQLYSFDGVTLGGGSSCSVMKMKERKTGNIYAVK